MSLNCSCYQKKLCEKCNKFISLPNYNKHLEAHKNHPKKYKKPILQHEGLNCIYCNKVYKDRGNLAKHEKYCELNPNKSLKSNPFVIEGFNNKGRKAWNKGLTKETDERVLKNSESVSKHFKEFGGTFKGKHHSVETKHKISLSKRGNNYGNRSKKGYYKNFYCDSTYELVYVIYCLDHQIGIKRCDTYYEYEYNGSKHLYFPDFEIDGCIIEIKGYHTELVDIKAAAVKDKPIKILYYNDIKYMFDYVFNKYNVDRKTLITLFTETLKV